MSDTLRRIRDASIARCIRLHREPSQNIPCAECVSATMRERTMADNLKGIPFNSSDEGLDFPTVAKRIAYDQAVSLLEVGEHPTFSLDEVYVVWFAYTLGNWKALCSTSLPDGRYYEVTYSKERGVGFVDTYRKTHNVEFTLT